MLNKLAPHLFPLSDPILIFAIVLLLFLAAPVVMSRFQLPGMIGLLIAGALLGPNALGLLARDASFVLLGSVGLIYIMFTAALEVDLTAFKKFGLHGVLFGLMTFLIPQTLGALLFHFVFRFDWMAALLIGSMFASHTLLAYPIASRMGLTNHPAVTTTLGATMVADTMALMVLAVIAAIAQGEMSEALWWRLGVSFVAFVSIVLLGLPRLGRYFFSRFGDDSTAHFVFVLASVFFFAAISHFFGLEPIIGAFLAGLALNRLIPHQSALMNRLTFTGEALFIPFFLLSVGMLLDATVLFGSWLTPLLAVGMTGTVLGSKWLAAHATRRLLSYSQDEGQVMYGLSVVQAAATLAGVMVGFRLGVFDEAIVNATILMILVTCILGPYLVNRHGPLVAEAWAQKSSRSNESGDQRSPHVLVPVQRADQLDGAMELAVLLHSSKQKAIIYPFHMVADGPEAANGLLAGEKLMDQALSLANAANCQSLPVLRVAEAFGPCLLRTARELAAPSIIMPWSFKGEFDGGAFSDVIDPVVAAQQNQIFICSLPKALGTCTRILFILPEPLNLNAQLRDSLQMMQKVAHEIGAASLLIGSQDDENIIKQVAQRAEKCTYLTHKSLRDWIPLLNETVRETDLLCFVSQGDGPEGMKVIANMGRLVRSKFPQNNVIISFSSTSP